MELHNTRRVPNSGRGHAPLREDNASTKKTFRRRRRTMCERSEHVDGEAHQLNPQVTTDTSMLEVPRYPVDWVGGLPPLMCSLSDITSTKSRFCMWGRGALSHTHSWNSTHVHDTHGLTLGQHISQHVSCAKFGVRSCPSPSRQRIEKKNVSRRPSTSTYDVREASTSMERLTNSVLEL